MKFMALILTLTILTALIFALLIIWVSIRYRKERIARRVQLPCDASVAVENGDGNFRVIYPCQPSGAPHITEYVGGAELVRVRARDEREPHMQTDKTEVWRERVASSDGLAESCVIDLDEVRVEENNVPKTRIEKVQGRSGKVAVFRLEGAGRMG